MYAFKCLNGSRNFHLYFLETFSYENLRRAEVQIRSCNYLFVPHNCDRVNLNIIIFYLIIINIWNLNTLFCKLKNDRRSIFLYYTARMIQLIQTIKCQLINIEWWYIHGWRVYTIIDYAFLLRSKYSDLDHPWKLSNYFHTILAAYDEHEQKPHQCDDPKIFEQMIHAVGTKYSYFLTGLSRCLFFDIIIKYYYQNPM